MLESFKKDHSLLRPKSKEWKQNAEIVKSGSTALVCDITVDSGKAEATVSNAGDCSLVVCRPYQETSSGTEIVWQTTDLNAKTPSEQERLAGEHPGEDLVIVGGRLFGKLMSTRGLSLPLSSMH